VTVAEEAIVPDAVKPVRQHMNEEAADELPTIQRHRLLAVAVPVILPAEPDLANEHQAELNLSYTTITAPFDGTVGVRTLQVGQFVQPGTQLMAIVPLHAVYITANYMETQLTHVRAGQPVTINVDTFDGTVVHGHVESLAPASGQQFALLPPDNATGNFIKIVQRIPVKIALDENDPLAGQLRPGMSVEPTIDTRPPRDAVVSTLNRSKVNG
jgi:multidrug resistance efflux pump